MKQHIWLYDNNLLTSEGAGALLSLEFMTPLTMQKVDRMKNSSVSGSISETAFCCQKCWDLFDIHSPNGGLESSF